VRAVLGPGYTPGRGMIAGRISHSRRNRHADRQLTLCTVLTFRSARHTTLLHLKPLPKPIYKKR
jgi:hypothetical protein